jgi:hypothetical protein
LNAWGTDMTGTTSSLIFRPTVPPRRGAEPLGCTSPVWLRVGRVGLLQLAEPADGEIAR